jgi:hypothetical protein
MLGTVTSAAAQDGADDAGGAGERRFSVEGAGGVQLAYVGATVSAAFGFAPTRNLTLLLAVERSHIRDKFEQYPDGYSLERGGTETFVSGELRYAFLVDRRVSPYVLGGTGRGRSKPNVNDMFPTPNERTIQVVYYGGGVRIPLGTEVDAFVDGRFMMQVEGRSDYFGVRFPVRGGVAWRF